MGGKTDGTSGPGVGAATIFVQEGGVGKMMLILGLGVALMDGVGVIDVMTQAKSRNESRMMNERIFLIEFPWKGQSSYR
jgi:hypothetical protein